MLTLSTVGSTRALFFRGPWGGSVLLVPSPGPGAEEENHHINNKNQKDATLLNFEIALHSKYMD